MSAIKIVVMGVGGCGTNAVHYMSGQDTLEGVEMICANTDSNHLDKSNADKKIVLGAELLGGLGTGGRVDYGKQAAEETLEEVSECIKDTNMLFLIAGLGKGTGTGATPVIAAAAKKRGILTVALVIRPSPIQIPRCGKVAEDAISELSTIVDSLVIIPNSLDKLGEDITVIDAYKFINSIFYQGIKGVTEVITKTGNNNIDFNDMRTIMTDSGFTLICQSPEVPKENHKFVIEQTLHNPLFDEVDIRKAQRILVNLTYGEDFEYVKVQGIMQDLIKLTEGNPNIVFGEVIDPELEGKVMLTLVLTGMELIASHNQNKDSTHISHTDKKYAPNVSTKIPHETVIGASVPDIDATQAINVVEEKPQRKSRSSVKTLSTIPVAKIPEKQAGFFADDEDDFISFSGTGDDKHDDERLKRYRKGDADPVQIFSDKK